MSFQSLTKYIKLLKNDSFGEWKRAEEKDGVVTMPYFIYAPVVIEFNHELHIFARNNSQYEMHNYKNILVKKGINNSTDIQEYDINNADAQTILCMMISVVQTDRFIEGTLLHYLDGGYFNKWLKRLKEIDMLFAKQKIDKTITFLLKLCYL